MTALMTGQMARPGVYMSFRHPDVRVVSGGERKLEGAPNNLYHRLPLVLVVPLVPVLGGLFAMAFPFIIFGAFLKAVGEWIWSVHTRRTGDVVKWGVYLGVSRPAVAYVGQTGETLEGRPGTRYVRLPTALVVLGCPMIGLLYVLFLPSIMLLALLWLALSAGIKRLGRSMAASTSSTTPDDVAHCTQP